MVVSHEKLNEDPGFSPQPSPAGGMFQPQPTLFSPFSSYGLGNPVHEFPALHSAGRLGGPNVFRYPILSPANNSIGRAPNFNHNNQAYNKMTANDLEEQEVLARTFQPTLQVSSPCYSQMAAFTDPSTRQGPLVGEKKSSHTITEEYAKADPIYVAKTAVSSLRILKAAPTNYPPGLTTYILSLSTHTWRWKLWMAG